MKIWITTQYDTYFDFDEWAEEAKEIPYPKGSDPIADFIECKLERAEDEGDYATVVAIEMDNDHRIYDYFKKTIEEKRIEWEWV